MTYADLARRVAGAQPLLLLAICVLSQWTAERITSQYRLSEADCVKCLAQLDRIGIIELRPLHRCRLKLAKTFRWRRCSWSACSGWRKTLRSSPRPTRSWPGKTARATPWCWPCAAGNSKPLNNCGVRTSRLA
jgi:hypothetical protein